MHHRPLLEIFSQEFPYFEDSEAYYREAMGKGRLRVNDEVVDTSYRCRDGDVVTHHVHRHEPPVTSHAVRILADVDGLLVVDKPPSVPCHPGGRYRRNSLLAILAKEHGLFDLHTVHRLDRLTSGLLLLGKTKLVAEQVRKEFEAGSVKKKYLARVVGTLPPGRTLVDQPIACKSHREAIHCIREEDGKPAQTVFSSLATCALSDGTVHSLVLCEPLTGRTHQIRLHLQWLGCPIANDPLYGPLGVGSTAAAHAHEQGAGDGGCADSASGDALREEGAGGEGGGESASRVGGSGAGDGADGEDPHGGGGEENLGAVGLKRPQELGGGGAAGGGADVGGSGGHGGKRPKSGCPSVELLTEV